MVRAIISICLLALFAIVATSSARADEIADFYRGKTINMYVSFPPGGGYDIYARLIAPYYTRHIPGNPTIIVRNMEGGSGVRAASYISNATPQDGTSLGVFLDNLTLGKVLGGTGDFDPVKMQWIGRMVSTATVALVWHTSPVQSVEEAKSKELIMAVGAASNSSAFIPLALNDLLGTRIKLIRGYTGSGPMGLAMEQGEANAIGAISWEALSTTKLYWLNEKKTKYLYTLSAQRLKAVPEAPALLDFAKDEKSERILGLLGSGPDIGRAIVAEPGAPAARVAALRKAFMETMNDPAYQDELRKRGLEHEPLSGEELQAIVMRAAATPKDLTAQARRYLGE